MKFSWLDKHKSLGLFLIRVGIGLVYLYFGISQLLRPGMFVGWLPAEAALIPLEATTLILLNGVFEVTFALLLLLGVYTRLSAFLLGLHLLGITFTIGFTEIGVRDFGLSLATLSIVFSGPDKYSLEKKFKW